MVLKQSWVELTLCHIQTHGCRAGMWNTGVQPSWELSSEGNTLLSVWISLQSDQTYWK